MKKNTVWALMLLAAPVVVSCSDINLSDVDSTISVPVKDMVVPLQVNDIKLSTMLDVTNDGLLREVNGDYAVVLEGDYKSNLFHIPAFTVDAQPIANISGSMPKSKPGAKKAPRRVDFNNPQEVAKYALPMVKETVAAYADQIDIALLKLKEVKAETKFHFTFNIDPKHELLTVLNKINVENFAVQLPRGIIGSISITNGDGQKVLADYSSETGLVSFIGKNIYTTTGEIELAGEVKGFNADLLEDAFRQAVGSNARRSNVKSEFHINEEFGVKSGEIVIYDTDFKDVSLTADKMFESLPDNLSYESTGEMDDITVKNVTGTFEYNVDDFYLDDVSLDDIPDLLRESGTDIHLDNPQIYVDFHNPVVDGVGKTIGASTNLTFVAKGSDGEAHTYKLDNETIEAKTSQYIFYLSPRAVADEEKYESFERAEHIPFTALSDVLSSVGGEEGGLPTSLSISATNTRIYGEDVAEFELGRDYFLNGRYAFVAPLALSEDSRLKYTDTVDGWNTSIEGVVITQLSLSANVTTDVPFELQMSIVPIDVEGKPVATCSPLIIPANAKNQAVEFTINGEIHELDGVKIDVTAVSKEARALQPGMNIDLGKLKVKVSGKYED